MEIKLILDGDIQVTGSEITYTGTVLSDLLEVSLHASACFSHTGNRPRPMILRVKRLVRGLTEDLALFGRYSGADGLMSSPSCKVVLPILNNALPAPDCFVGKYVCNCSRLAALRMLNGPIQEAIFYVSGVNQSGRDGTAMLAEPIQIDGFEVI